MSGESFPITPAVFAEAIKELPLSAVYGKASELQNSITHLQRSNDELRVYVAESCETDSEKRELETYVAENEGVITAMTERIQLLKAEIEARGQRWIEPQESESKAEANGDQSQNPNEEPTVNGTGVREGSAGEEGGEEEGIYL